MPAVTNTVIVFEPTDKGMLADGEPEVVTLPLTVTVAVESLVVGVTVMDDVAFETAAVYVVVAVAKAGLKVAVLSCRLARFALPEDETTLMLTVAVLIPPEL